MSNSRSVPSKFVLPPGAAVDQNQLRLMDEALAYAEEHGIDFVDAVCRLTGEEKSPAVLSRGGYSVAAPAHEAALAREALEYAELHGIDFVEAVHRITPKAP